MKENEEKIEYLGGFDEIKRLNKAFKNLGEKRMEAFIDESKKINMSEPFKFAVLFKAYLMDRADKRITLPSFAKFIRKVNTDFMFIELTT